jgi:hypothetical protein
MWYSKNRITVSKFFAFAGCCFMFAAIAFGYAACFATNGGDFGGAAFVSILSAIACSVVANNT